MKHLRVVIIKCGTGRVSVFDKHNVSGTSGDVTSTHIHSAGRFSALFLHVCRLLQ